MSGNNGDGARRDAKKILTIPAAQQPAEQLTELETTKMQLFALRHQVLQQQLQANLVERAQLIAGIEAAHPGHRWNEATGQLEAQPKPVVP